MGQYWYPVNLDKKEFIHPHKLGNGLKLWEQLASHPGTGAALILLTAAMPEPRGGGDIRGAEGIVGRWAGDRIAFVGDYAEPDDLPDDDAAEVYRGIEDGTFEDVSDMVCEVLEKQLGGKFSGGGWRTFVYNDEEV